MEKEELQRRINNKNKQIEKLNKKIERYENQKNTKSFLKEYAYMINDQIVLTMEEFVARLKMLRTSFKDDPLIDVRVNNWYVDYMEDRDVEIRQAKREIEECKNMIQNYKNKLLLAEQKENKPVVQIFLDFMNNWKNEVKEFVNKQVEIYHELDNEYCELHNYHRNEEGVKERLKELSMQMSQINQGWVRTRLDKGRKDFDKYLDKYFMDRYYELCNKVTSIIGEITDVSKLYFGNDGSLNGIIIGTEGSAKVETIIAGGYNIQCLHYRVLVHKINK